MHDYVSMLHLGTNNTILDGGYTISFDTSGANDANARLHKHAARVLQWYPNLKTRIALETLQTLKKNQNPKNPRKKCPAPSPPLDPLLTPSLGYELDEYRREDK
jgi:hypothetical protein